MQDVDEIVNEATAVLTRIDDAVELEQVKARYLGKNGSLTEQLKALGTLAPEERKNRGGRINVAKAQLEKLVEDQRKAIRTRALEAQLAQERLDVTLPGRGAGVGGVHPITRVTARVEKLFASMGFEVADGPEIETDFYNFTALNMPEDHPARAMHDTFYIDGKHVLRTHTSPIQIRYMQAHKPPVKIIAPGRVYRVDSDATHSPMFHQLEGLWIDEQVSFADLKGVLTEFLQKFFERTDLTVRLRPSFFPFTEPSAEVDMSTPSGGWMEIAGCGMVHPNVLKHVGIDSERYGGFAFGMGLDRLAMLRYGVNDLRLFFQNDLRFLKQFD